MHIILITYYFSLFKFTLIVCFNSNYFIYFQKVFRWGFLIKTNVKNVKITLSPDDFLPKGFTAFFSRSLDKIHPTHFIQ